MKIFIYFFMIVNLYSQSFYVLSNVTSYENLIITNSDDIDEDYIEEIESAMKLTSDNLHIDTTSDSSSVLTLMISKFSVGETIAFKVSLELGEYVKRSNYKKDIFALTYVDTKFIDEEYIDDNLVDIVEDMLDNFYIQYKDDNEKRFKLKKITHKTFAIDMSYETNYKVALTRAKIENKPLMIFMTINYCPWCRKMENRVLIKENIDKKIKTKFIPVMLNINHKKFPNKLGNINIVPTIYIINHKTENIDRTFIGYSSKDDFINFLNRE